MERRRRCVTLVRTLYSLQKTITGKSSLTVYGLLITVPPDLGLGI